MNNTLWHLTGMIRGLLQADEYCDEIALLCYWKYLLEQPRTKDLITFSDILSEGQTLEQAYQSLARFCGDKINGYNKSKLPGALNLKKAREIVQWLERTPRGSAKDYVIQIAALARMLGRSSGSSEPSEELMELMSGLSRSEGSESYAPFRASIWIAAWAQVHGAVVTHQSSVLSYAAEVAAALTGVQIVRSAPLIYPVLTKSGKLKQFSSVTLIPVFGAASKGLPADPYNRFNRLQARSEITALEHGLAQCANRLICLQPLGFAFRSRDDYEMRIKLVERGWLEAVIQLPESQLSDTKVSTLLLLIDKGRSSDDDIFFYSADFGVAGFCREVSKVIEDVLNRIESQRGVLVSKESVQKNKYDLSVSKYVLGRASAQIKSLENTVPLKEVADLIRGQLLKEDPEPSGDVFLEVGVKDILDSGAVKPPLKSLRLSGRKRDRAQLQRLFPGDVLLTVKGSVGIVGIVGEDCEENWVASQIFQVIRLRKNSQVHDPRYLYMLLASPLIQAYLREHASGSTITVLKSSDVQSLPVPVEDKYKQKSVVGLHTEICDRFLQIEKIKSDIQDRRSSKWALY